MSPSTLLARKIADVPVFLNSPMAVDSSRIFHKPAESEELNRRRGPMIIIARSGMAPTQQARR